MDHDPTDRIGGSDRESSEIGESASNDVARYFDKIIFSLVPASDSDVATSLAAGGLTYRDGKPPLPDGASPEDSFELVENFDDFSLSEVTDWTNLPNSVAVDSALGGELLERVRERIDWDAHSQYNTLLYDQYGNGFATPEELDAYLSEQEELWLVLAVSYRLVEE